MEECRKIIVVGDLHIDNRKYSIKNSETFDEVFRLFNQITYLVLENKAEFVVFLGDIFDSPENISTNAISVITMLFKNLSELTRIIILAGNHDSMDDTYQNIDLTEGKNESIRSSLVYPFSMSSEIFVADKPLVSDLDQFGTNLPKIQMSFIPYQTDIVKSLDYIIPKLRDGYAHIMFGHFETSDMNYIKILKDKGLVENVPSAEDLFSKYKQDLVFLGHVHERSEITINDKKLIYTGSARNINYNNKEEEKGIYILNIDTLESEFVKNDNTAIYKIFRNAEDFDKYLAETDDEKLAKTKVKFIYTDSKETVRYNEYKKKLRRLEFEKSIFVSDNNSEEVANTIILDELKMENLMNKDNLFNFILNFKNIPEEERLSYLEILKKMEG